MLSDCHALYVYQAGIDSSSRFPCTEHTHRHTHTQSDATGHHTHTLATIGVGNNITVTANNLFILKKIYNAD